MIAAVWGWITAKAGKWLAIIGTAIVAVAGAFLMGWMKRGEHDAGKSARKSLDHVKDYKDVQDDIDRMSPDARRERLRDLYD